MVVTLGQQYNVGENPTVILYTYIDRHAERATEHNKAGDTLVIIYDMVITYSRVLINRVKLPILLVVS